MHYYQHVFHSASVDMVNHRKKNKLAKESTFRGRSFFFQYPDIFPRVGLSFSLDVELRHL